MGSEWWVKQDNPRASCVIFLVLVLNLQSQISNLGGFFSLIKLTGHMVFTVSACNMEGATSWITFFFQKKLLYLMSLF